MSGHLNGVRVIEFAGIGPAPFCGMLFADMGADVVRVDRVQQVELGQGIDPKYDFFGRGKRSLGIDLKKPQHLEMALRLVERADVLIEGYRPDVPSIAETVPGYDITIDTGFLVPAGTPNDIVEKLHAEIVKVLTTPEIVQHLTTLGIIPIGSSPKQYAETIRADLTKFARLVKESGARVD